MARGIRKRLEHSRVLAFVLGRALGPWLRLCRATTRWDVTGRADLDVALAEGPVILILWHEGAMMSAALWATTGAPLSSLRADSAMGRISGSVQAHFGLLPMGMSDRQGNVAASREVLRRLRDGVSVGLTGDGPLGPARVLQGAGLEWARASGRPVFVMGWGVMRQRRLATWDRMVLPLPFTRGRLIWARWDGVLPRRASPGDIAAAQTSLSALMSATMDAAQMRR
jgi:lysophospholipid acyltransferase (LPLAT)-like uncharacterized protein